MAGEEVGEAAVVASPSQRRPIGKRTQLSGSAAGQGAEVPVHVRLIVVAAGSRELCQGPVVLRGNLERVLEADDPGQSLRGDADVLTEQGLEAATSPSGSLSQLTRGESPVAGPQGMPRLDHHRRHGRAVGQPVCQGAVDDGPPTVPVRSDGDPLSDPGSPAGTHDVVGVQHRVSKMVQRQAETCVRAERVNSTSIA